MASYTTICNGSDIINYNIDHINCENIPHEFDEYYTSACDIWRQEMRLNTPTNMIQCVTGFDGYSGKSMHGCKPAFGRNNDRIAISYHFKKLENTCISEKNVECPFTTYEITAKAVLYNPIHPYVIYLGLSLFAVFLVIYCITKSDDESEYDSAYDGAFWGAFMGSSCDSYDSSNSWSWTYDD